MSATSPDHSAVSAALRSVEDPELRRSIADLGEFRDRPAGTIRITTVEHAAKTVLLPRLAALLPDYPDITVEIVIDYGLVDIVARRFDAGVRLGEQIADESAGRQLVELVGGHLEQAPGPCVQLVVRQVQFRGEVVEELALLVGAVPGDRSKRRGRRLVVSVDRNLAVVVTGDEAGLLDLVVDRSLQELVEARDFGGDLGEVSQFGLDADRELVGGEAGQSQLLAVIGCEGDGHGMGFLSGWIFVMVFG